MISYPYTIMALNNTSGKFKHLAIVVQNVGKEKICACKTPDMIKNPLPNKALEQRLVGD